MTCLGCGVPAASDMHHVWPQASGGGNQEGNLVPLCRACHECVTLPCDGDRSVWLLKGLGALSGTREGRILILKVMTLLAYVYDAEHGELKRSRQFEANVASMMSDATP